ncbi:MAG: DUF134 domain-containing protein, partial [Promethearchaeota archaeon]
MRRRRRGRRGRHPFQDFRTGVKPKAKQMEPKPLVDSQPLYIDEAEIEALRLIDLEGFYQEDAGMSMNVSRGTIWRLITSARRKIAQAVFEGR